MKTTKIYYGGLRRVIRAASGAMNVLIALVAIYLLCGCSASYYAPAAHNVPMFREKKEYNLSGDFRIGNDTKGYDIQAAVAATDHLGITANYSHYNGEESSFDSYYWETSSVGYSSSTVEFGLGYYLPFAKNAVFEVYSGYGTSNFKSENGLPLNYGITQVHSNSFFVQPDIGFRMKHIELAFSNRFRVNSYNNVSHQRGYHSDYYGDESILDQHPVVCFIEPALTFRVGGEHVKFQIQAGRSILVSKNTYISYDPLNLNFGLIFRLGGKKEADPVK